MPTTTRKSKMFHTNIDIPGKERSRLTEILNVLLADALDLMERIT